MEYLIGIDIGTSGTKTVLFETTGKSVSSFTAEYSLYQPKVGWAEQNPEDWLSASIEGIAAVLKQSQVDPSHVLGVGLSGQMHGLVLLDKNNKVLRPSIIWCDQRTGEECEEITSIIGKDKLIEITANPALTGFTASKIRWVQKHEPELYAKVKHILLPKDYVRFGLTGEYASEVSDASGMQLMNISERRWSDEVCARLEVDMSLLPKLYESYEVSGSITKRVASLTGLMAGTPVVGGAGDQAAAAVGSGIVRSGVLSDTLGTSGVVFAHTDAPLIDPKGRVHTFCHAVPNAWHIMGVTQACGLSLQWFRNEFFREEKAAAPFTGVDAYQVMDKLASKVPVGSEGLLYLPYLMGERTPHLDEKARGVFFGLSARHTREYLLRSVMEGICYSQRDCLEIIQGLNLNATEIRMGGGGAKSLFLRSMITDCFGVPTATVGSKEGGALGVAILAGVGVGVYDSVTSACEKLITTQNHLQPDPANKRVYDQFYPLYQSLYASLQGEFNTLKNIMDSIDESK